ncbi:MAG TPA: glycosyltransferase family 2 protein [Candidatus Angelobacter sp.]|nr:glycosyltransferase family 2 protein [Candidatus Angelobacter sp.]
MSIIILNWNSYQMTSDCLRSLANIDFSGHEVVLVDNGSHDGSPDQLSRDFPSVRLLRNPKNLGFAGGNNVGIRDALERGPDYLLLLNNDTVVAPNFLSELLKVGESDARIGLLNPKIYYFDPPDHIWYAGGMRKPGRVFPVHLGLRQRDDGTYNKTREVSFITGCALLIKAAVVRQIGLLDELFFLSFEDADWSMRASRAGFQQYYVPSSVIWHKDSYDTNRNLGHAGKNFHTMRNSVLFARKYLERRHWPLFMMSLGKYVAYRTVAGLRRRDINAITALYRGIWNGCRTSLSQSRTGRPEGQLNF